MIKQSRLFYRFIYYPLWLLFHLVHPRWHVTGKEKIPPEPYMMVCNHSAATDIIYLAIAANPYRLFRIMAKKELMDIPVIGWLLGKLGAFAVDREGNDTGAVMAAMKTLKSGQSLLLFPEGTRVRPGEPSHPKGGAVLLASRCNVPVVPVYLTQHKRLFRPIRIAFGEPYMIQTSGRHIPQEEQERLIAEMMEKCYSLGEDYEY